jgi:hypothetical protein
MARGLRFVSALTIAVLLAACSGGGSRTTPQPSGGTVTNPTSGSTLPTAMIRLTFSIPGTAPAASSTTRKPEFVSNQINSAIVSAYQLANPANPRGNTNNAGLVSSYIDLTPTSPNCTGGTPRTCSIFLPAPVTPSCNTGTGAGCDFFEIDTYSGAPLPSSPCGGGAAPACTGVTGNQLSIGTDGNGASDNGYNVTAGGNVSVSLGLEGIIKNFALTTPATWPNGVGANWPAPFNDTAHPLFALSGLAGVGTNTPVVLEAQTGFPNALDAGGAGGQQAIRGGTCTNGDLFANGITTNANPVAGVFFAQDGGAGGPNQTQLKLQPCGTSGFLPSPAQGISTFFPNDQIQGTYSGGGGSGNEEVGPAAPYYSYLTGTAYDLFTTGQPLQNNWVSPPTTGGSAYAHPYPLSPTPICNAGGPDTGCTHVNPAATAKVNLAVVPLFAQTFTGAAGQNENDSAAGGPNPGHAVLNLSGPGSSGRIYADQVIAPTTPLGASGGNYAFSPSAGCSGTVNGTSQQVGNANAPTLLRGNDGTPALTGTSGFGLRGTITGGNYPSPHGGGTLGDPTLSCVLTISDGINSVPVWISNSVANGNVSIPSQPTPPPGIVVYNNIASPLLSRYYSQGFQSNHELELGDGIVPTQTGPLDTTTVVLSSQGCYTGNGNDPTCSTPPGATFTEDVTMNVYKANGTQVGALVGSLTQTFSIPYRPSYDAVNCNGTGRWFSPNDGSCASGISVPLTFNWFTQTAVQLPSPAIVTLTYNTTTYGYHPTGCADTQPSACDAVISLNVLLRGLGGSLDPGGVGSVIDTNSIWQALHDPHSPYEGGACDPTPFYNTSALQIDNGCWGSSGIPFGNFGLHPQIQVVILHP